MNGGNGGSPDPTVPSTPTSPVSPTPHVPTSPSTPRWPATLPTASAPAAPPSHTGHACCAPVCATPVMLSVCCPTQVTGTQPSEPGLPSDPSNPTVTLPPGLPTQVDPDLNVLGVEQTQAIQRFSLNQLASAQPGSGAGGIPTSEAPPSSPTQPPSLSTNNSVPLVAGRPTILRLFATRVQPRSGQLTGKLVYTPPGGTSTGFPPENQYIQTLPGPQINRGDPSHSLNFRIPAEHAAGSLDCILVTFDPATPGLGSEPTRITLAFGATQLVRVRGFMIRRGAEVPQQQEFINAMEAAKAYLPIPGYEFSGIEELVLDDDISGVRSRLASLRNDSDSDEIYVGLVKQRPSDGNLNGEAGSRALAARIERPDTIAHELAHLFGRDHVRGCGETPAGADDRYPNPDGSIGEVGFNVYASDASSAVKDPDLGDLMTYCRDRWVSPYTYVGCIAGASRDPERENPGEPIAEILRLNFRVKRFAQPNKSRAVELQSYVVAPGRLTAGGRNRKSPFSLILRSGNHVQHHACDFVDSRQNESDPIIYFNEKIILQHKAIDAVEFYMNDDIIQSVNRKNMILKGIKIHDCEFTLAGDIDVTWSTDPNNPPLDVLLRYSPDGTRWYAVSDNSMTFAPGKATIHALRIGAPVRDQAAVEVIATEKEVVQGVRARANVDFQHWKDIDAHILWPETDRLHYLFAGQTLRASACVGYTYSQNGKEPASQQLIWTSSLDGMIGSGPQLSTTHLSLGRHDIQVYGLSFFDKGAVFGTREGEPLKVVVFPSLRAN